MLVDSHCHLSMLKPEEAESGKELDSIMTTAYDYGVEHMLCVGVDLASAQQVVAIADAYPNVDCSVGVHPSEAGIEIADVDKITELAQHKKVVAIGEMGLDYFRLEEDDQQTRQLQQDNFSRQIQAAKQLNKPIIIHTRSAQEDTLRIMREEKAEAVSGVMHCFTESWEMAKAALDLGFYVSISGIVTFKKAEQVKEVASKVPLDRLLIETDSPYLAPVPYRGKQNHPGLVRYVAEAIADLKNLSFAEVAERTTENYFNLFSEAQHV